jgi:hypothetical protein
MDTLFSQYRLSGTRLAKLMITPPERRAPLLSEWHPANDNEQKETFIDYYRRARSAVRRFHRHAASESELRAQAALWRREARTPSDHCLDNNARAVVQYLDEHRERELVVLRQQTLEGYFGGLRVTAQPHLCALDGPDRHWIWLECSERLDEPRARARAEVTLLIAKQMGMSGGVEIIHAASRRILAPTRMSAGLEVNAATICERIRIAWSARDRK